MAAAEGLMTAGWFGWSREVKASEPCPELIHYPAPAATHSQPPPKQPFTGSFLLRDSLTQRPGHPCGWIITPAHLILR